jgi:hypothetical protein
MKSREHITNVIADIGGRNGEFVLPFINQVAFKFGLTRLGMPGLFVNVGIF